MPSSFAERKEAPWIVSTLLVVAVLIVFGQAGSFEFINLDDKQYVTQNAQVLSGLNGESVGWAFTTGHAGNWHPLTWLSHMLDVEMWGENPGGHHLTSVLLHALNAVVLFLAFRGMTGRFWASAFVAALFALHPMRAESVAWVSERKDVLCAFFGLCCIWAWGAYARRPGPWRYGLAALLLAFGLMAKPMLVTWPFLLLLLDYWPLRRKDSWGKLALEKLPLLGIAIGSSVITFIVQRGGGAVAETAVLPLGERLANAITAYLLYIGGSVTPGGRSVYYTHPYLPGGTPLATWMVLVSAFLLLVATWLAWRARGKGYPWVGWCWFVGTLVPVIGIVQVGIQAMADRYSYLPLIGLYIIAAFSFAEDADRKPSHRKAIAAVSVLILLVFAGLALRQTARWRNSETLMAHSLTISPTNPVLNYSLAEVRADQGRVDEAIDGYRKTLEIDPGYAEAHNNLANLLRDRGDFAGAEGHFRSAIEADPGLAEAHNNLGTLMAQARRFDEALRHLRRAVELEPDDHETRFNLGLTLMVSGDAAGAESAFRQVLELAPGYPRALAALERLGEDAGGNHGVDGATPVPGSGESRAP